MILYNIPNVLMLHRWFICLLAFPYRSVTEWLVGWPVNVPSRSVAGQPPPYKRRVTVRILPGKPAVIHLYHKVSGIGQFKEESNSLLTISKQPCRHACKAAKYVPICWLGKNATWQPASPLSCKKKCLGDWWCWNQGSTMLGPDEGLIAPPQVLAFRWTNSSSGPFLRSDEVGMNPKQPEISLKTWKQIWTTNTRWQADLCTINLNLIRSGQATPN